MGTAYKYSGYYRSITHFIPHPEYLEGFRRNDLFFGFLNDIALIRLSSPVVFSNTIAPICLSQPHHTDTSFRQCYVTGWGQLDPEYRK